MKRRNKWLLTLGITATVVLGAATAAGNYFYSVAIATNKKEFLENDKNLPEKEKVDIWKAEKEWYQSVQQETITMTSDDNLTLVATYIPAEKPSKKVAILAHGYAGNRTNMAAFAKLYYDMGFNILVPDARGHGESQGDYIGFGWHERLDYVRWIDEMIAKNGKESEIALFGISMGGATVMMTSGEALPDNVKVIVEDCGYSSVNEELAYQLKEMYNLPAFPLVPITSVVTQIRAGYNFDEASAVKQLEKNKTPMLFIHGDQDTFVPTEMLDEVYTASPAEKEKHIFEGAGHGESYGKHKAAYKELVTTFIEKYIP
ncbi:alpha/beta hydrolase [Isobaculum melis]|uniref:Peptidase S9 prolyl oligopeptidase catalytic domain-containing protein n=1 Tax=Isobaculum melis TaxID=142588 RepID=A0A1H9T6G2_9LACT|nr:alpha/beta hydrolase [Isobaculum melis]SER92716.1 hypothetical protein SAMN04488559_1114 [Isobaculum melis]